MRLRRQCESLVWGREGSEGDFRAGKIRIAQLLALPNVIGGADRSDLVSERPSKVSKSQIRLMPPARAVRSQQRRLYVHCESV